MMEIKVTRTTSPKKKPEKGAPLGFGKIFTDHMFTMLYTEGKGWHDAEIRPYEDFKMDPASMVLHYGQAIFEGLKAYKVGDDIQLFRPMDNLRRFNRSADRLCIPNIDEEFVLGALKQLLEIEKDWIPTEEGTSLYIRPTAVATDPFLGVKVASEYLFFIILSPVGAYYEEGIKPVKIFVENEYVRSVRGGMGFAKAAGNYACSLIADHTAHQYGCAQVLWLDGVHRKYIEEVGSMNIFFVIDGEIITPPLEGSILGGITRDSIIKVARDLGYKVSERKLSIQEVFEAHDNGKLDEAFGTGTAAVISPVGGLVWEGREITIHDNVIGPIAQKCYDTLTGIQFGKIEDKMGWTMKV